MESTYDYLYYAPFTILFVLFYYKNSIIYNLAKTETRCKLLYKNISNTVSKFYDNEINENIIYFINDKQSNFIEYETNYNCLDELVKFLQLNNKKHANNTEDISSKKIKNDSNIKLIIYKKYNEKRNMYYVFDKSVNNDTFNNMYCVSEEDCNIKFMAIELEYNNKKYNIRLSSDKFTFYLNNNIILSKEFIKWYMLKILNIKMQNNSYKIVILDNKFKQITLSPNQKIVLTKDSYNIIN